MKECSQKSFYGFLKNVYNLRFEIPLYQRHYSWTTDDCERLLQDIFEIANLLSPLNPMPSKMHFTGSIVCFERTTNIGMSGIKSYDIIDGQQRLTTLLLIIKAMCEIGKAINSPSAAFSGILCDLESQFKVTPDGVIPASENYKLIMHTNDDLELKDIINGKISIPSNSKILRENYVHIKKALESYICGDENKITYLKNTLVNFEICAILLDCNDNPQDIFETLNSTGKDLSISDLVRNRLLMPVSAQSLKKHYAIWEQIEKDCKDRLIGDKIDEFIINYLNVVYASNKKISLNDTRKTYYMFKNHSDKEINAKIFEGMSKDEAILVLLNEIKAFSRIYEFIIKADSTTYSNKVKRYVDNLREMKNSTAVPFLLCIFRDYDLGIIDESTLLKTLQLNESCLVRWAFSNSFKQLNTFYASLYKNVFERFPEAKTNTNYYNAIATYFEQNKWVLNDKEFERLIITAPIYSINSNMTGYVLKAIENCGVATIKAVGTIEHILPQTLSPTWVSDLGGLGEAEKTKNIYLHTLGNLTLLVPNAAVSNNPFTQKVVDYSNPSYCKAAQLNIDVITQTKWGSKEIENRAKRLARIMIKGIPAYGTARTISPLFPIPIYTLLGKENFLSILVKPSLLQGKKIYGYSINSSSVVEVLSRSLREFYKQLVENLYLSHKVGIDKLANYNTNLLTRGQPHFLNAPPTGRNADRYYNISATTIYYYNNFSFSATIDIVKSLLNNLSINMNDLDIYLY